MVQTRQRRQIILKRRSNEASLFNRRLPLELITAIFEICCNSGSTTRNTDLLAICAVCSSWRFIAIGASMLWNTIQYCSNSSKRPLVDLLGIHVVRSKIAPLFVEISAHGDTTAEIESVAALLRPHLWRCRYLELNFSRPGTAELFLPLPQSMPFLRYLSIAIKPAYSPPNSPNTPPIHEETIRLSLFSGGRAECAPHSIHIYVPNDVRLVLPTFTNLKSLQTLGLALNLPSTQMLDIATRAPQLRSLDLMIRHPEPVERRDFRFSYPKLERQRIAGDGCTSLIPAPYLRSLTLVDEASMRAVDQLMTSRPSAYGRNNRSPTGVASPLFPQLRSLTFVFGGTSDALSVERSDNLARFISEHEELVSLSIAAGWVPVPYLLNASLVISPTCNTGGTGNSIPPRLPCPRLELIKLDMVLPIGLHSLGEVLDSLVRSREELATNLTIGTDFEIPDTLQNLRDAYPGRVVLRTRRG